MNTMIMNKLPTEYKMLYELSFTKLLDRQLKNALQDAVRTIKNDTKDEGEDSLAHKLSIYGNQGRWAQRQIEKLSRVIYHDKSPGVDNLGRWLSVEIECIMPDKDAETNFVMHMRKMKLSNQITVKDDGSVHPNNNNECECDEETLENSGCECNCEYGKEIVVTFQYGDWAPLQAVCDKLNEIGCYVNKSCGLHVHFDCRHLKSGRNLGTMARRVARAVPVLKKLLPKSRQTNHFCEHTINTLKGGDRYSFVNMHSYNKHRTLEIRGHSGTTDASKIVNWIKVLRTIMDTKCTVKFETLEQLVTNIKFEPELVMYMIARHEKFNSVDANWPILRPNPRAGDDVTEDNQSTSPQMQLSQLAA